MMCLPPRRTCASVFLVLGLLLIPGFSQAHDSRPLLIEITEIEAGLFRTAWLAPPSLPAVAAPGVAMPPVCRNMADAGTQTPGRTRLYQCPQGLAGGRIAIEYPAFNPSLSTLIRLSYQSGEQVTKLLGPGETRWQVPGAESKATVARDYTRLGIDHIWKGYDHLLFVLCLLWIAGGVRRVLVTVTGFTLAHSLTLALSALNIVTVPIPPVEAAIALSIVFLAREILVGRRDSLTWRYPIAVSSTFGLLHGLGFAAALAETGLPQTQLLTGLVFFNIGVETGQILFVLAVVGFIAIFRFIRTRWVQSGVIKLPLPLSPARATPYLVGIVSAFWLIERFAGFIPHV